LSHLYIHIPFCKKACIYCNFYFSTQKKYIPDYITALKKEILLTQNYLSGNTLSTLYLGGGTPSLLSIETISEIMTSVRKIYSLTTDAEITLEANPDDITTEYLHGLHNLGINRISVGIQSFSDKFLTLLHRPHSSADIYNSINAIKKSRLNNYNLDVIFNIPGMSAKEWTKTLNQLTDINPSHISAYSLTVEEKTALYSAISRKRLEKPDKTVSQSQYLTLLSVMQDKGYAHYEISNFAKSEKYSRHNSAYWKQKKYLGLGPGAHSYNTVSRQWNKRSLSKYIKDLSSERLPFEKEVLSSRDIMNEYILTGLRTSDGISTAHIQNSLPLKEFGIFSRSTEKWIHKKCIIKQNDILTLTKQGKCICDTITADLFIDQH
jgi:oxygen-independent coproporphyrinogen-3 oxidase